MNLLSIFQVDFAGPCTKNYKLRQMFKIKEYKIQRQDMNYYFFNIILKFKDSTCVQNLGTFLNFHKLLLNYALHINHYKVEGIFFKS
jgi:hypothetical protein